VTTSEQRIEVLEGTREMIAIVLGFLDRGRRLISVRERAGLPPMSDEFRKSMEDREAELVKLRHQEAALVEMVRADQ
jgi:hypothetical protein